MGCVSCNQSFNNVSNISKIKKRPFIQILQIKLGYIRNLYHENDAREFLQQFISQQQCQSIIALPQSSLLSQSMHLQDILSPEAGQSHYLSPIRRTIWKLFIFDISVNQYHKMNITHKFISSFEQSSSLSLQSQHYKKYQKNFYQISLDINRTFPLNKLLNRKDLEVCLRNLNMYFHGVGYTQGMNFVVGFMLLCGFAVKESYFMFVHMTMNRNFLLVRNFSQGFKNVLFMVSVLEEEMNKIQKLKFVKDKISQFGLTAFFYSFSWFLCYFMYSLEPKCAVLIWNFMITYTGFSEINININKINKKSQQNHNKIQQKDQYQQYYQSLQNSNHQYFTSILSCRGSLINLLLISLQLILHLSQQISECESSEQLMRLVRNETLQQKIQPQNILEWIQNIKQMDKNMINWKFLIEKMKIYDQEMYQIQINDDMFKKYVLCSMGIRGKEM